MNCPKCGKEVGSDNVCKDCGTKITPTNSEEQTKVNNFEPISEEKTNNKKTNKLLFVIIALVVVVAAVAVYYFSTINTARYIFDKKIDEYLTSDKENSEYNTLKVNADFEMSLKSEEAGTEQLSDLINDAKFSINAEVDVENQEELMGIKIDKANDELINAKIKLDAETQKMYMNLGELFSKTIEMDIDEVSDESFEIADTSISSFGQRVNAEKAEAILKKEVKSQLKDEYFSSEKAEIDGESVTKNKLRLTGKQLNDVVQNTCKNLSENEEFIECFEDGEQVKADLDEISSQFEELDMPEDTYMEIDVYAKGIAKTIKRVDLSVEDGEEKVTFEFKKISDEEYDYTAKSDDEKVFDGKIKVQEDGDNFTVEFTANADGTEIGFKVTGNVVYNEQLSDFDTSNSVKYDELTSEDMNELGTNLMNSKLYEIIEGLSSTSSNTSLIDSDEEDEKEVEPTTEEVEPTTTEDETKKEETSSNIEDNVIKTYDDTTIKFNIPAGFEIYSSDSEHYKLFEKDLDDGSIDVDVSTSYSSLNDYVDEIKERAETYKTEEEYSNVNLSEVEEIEVNGNKFKKMTLTYDYSLTEDRSTTYNELYIAYEVDSDNLYTVEIDGAELISDDELNAFLTIEK